jgi:hypothetical protein
MRRSLTRLRTALVAATVVTATVPGQVAAQLTSFTSQPAFAAAAGATSVITFESFLDGTAITNQLAGIDAVSGINAFSLPASVRVGSSATLPFPMFVAGTLPSETNFLSIDMGGVNAAAGSITFDLASSPKNAIGAFIADGAPLGGFNIELFNGALSLGSISVGPRTLPDAFVGVTSVASFTRAVFSAASTVDSWGLDNLEFSAAVTVTPEPASLALVATGVLALGGAWRRRRSAL